MDPREAALEALRQIDPREMGRRLKIARRACKLQQKDAVKRLPFSSSYLSSLENGKAKPTPENLEVLAALYGEPVGWFLSKDAPVGIPEPSRVLGDIDHVALAALRELPPAQQRALLLDVWPRVRDLCAFLHVDQEVVELSSP